MQRIVFSSLLFLVGATITYCGATVVGNRPTERHFGDPGVDASVPSPDLTPEQVVSLQCHAVRQSKTDPSRITVCYSLASPSNRSSTGPIERFATMVHAPPYDKLAASDDFQIGTAEIEGDRAFVLVSVFNAKEGIFGFRFGLSRQTSPPFQDCWLTDEVVALPPMPLDEEQDPSLGERLE